VSALERIAELHTQCNDEGCTDCAECHDAWPCPTRRLCDEADVVGAARQQVLDAVLAWLNGANLGVKTQEDYLFDIEGCYREYAALAAHDAARAEGEPAATLKWVDDTGALRTMAVHVANGLDFIVEYGRLTPDEQRVVVDWFMSEVAARTKEGPNGFLIEDLCDADD